MPSPNDTRQHAGLFRGRLRGLGGLLLLVAFCAPWFNIPRDNADSAGMLAHLHAYLVDFDLLYDDEMRALRLTPTFTFVTEQGVVSNHWPSGATWLQAPAYALGLVATTVLEALGLRSGGTLGPVPLLAIRCAAMLVLWRTAAAVFEAFARHCSSVAAGRLAALAFVVGTPLLYYASESPLRPHVWGCGVMTALVLLWWRRDWGTPMARVVALATLAGLAIAIRPQLAPAWLLVFEDAWRAPVPRRARLRMVAVGAAVASIWPLLHLRLQLWIYGPSLMDTLSPVTHHVRAFLWAPYHGALSWSPLLGLAAIALVWAVAKRERAAWLLLGLVVVQVWLNAGMRDIEPYRVLGTRTWSGGTSFGARKLVDALPLVLPSTLGATAAVVKRGWGRVLAAGVLVLIVPSAMLHAAAWVDPRTVSEIVDARGLSVLLSRATEPSAWSAAFEQRSFDAAATAVLVLFVTTPLALVATRLRNTWRLHSIVLRVRTHVVLALALAAVAHVAVSAMMVRSDLALADDPQRMASARARFHPAHEAAVARIAGRHATLRAVVGEHAAPRVVSPPQTTTPSTIDDR